MTLNLVSPGVKVREVDLTIGRVDAVNELVGAIAGPFEKGPVDVPVLIETEQDLLQTFGKPLSTDGQYGYWLSASNFLSYGGVLRVLRSDEAAGSYLNNANVGVTTFSLTVQDTFNDSFSGFTFGELEKLNTFENLFDGDRRTFNITKTVGATETPITLRSAKGSPIKPEYNCCLLYTSPSPRD